MKYFKILPSLILLAIVSIDIIAYYDISLSQHIITYGVIILCLYLYLFIIYPLIQKKIIHDDEAKTNRLIDEKREIERKEFDKKIVKIIEDHANTLSIQQSRRIKKDVYGNTFEEDWDTEFEYFINNTIKNKLTDNEKELLKPGATFQKIVSLVHNAATERNIALAQSVQFYDNMSGEDYELLCKSILTKNGWIVDTTKKTGDQGVDLVAHKNDVRVAIQCKRYSGSIGNDAVQQIIAGKMFYKAHFGIVVSNAPYTQSAKVLADSLNIKLLHHNNLHEVDFHL